MPGNFSRIAERLRDRIGEQVLAGAPQWLAAARPAAGANAGSLLIGTLLGRLPEEDVTALAQGILSEQNREGSWSSLPGGEGDLSLTLEVVEALSTCGHLCAREALDKAVHWLEEHRHAERLNEETLILLSAITELVPGRLRRMAMPTLRKFMLRRAQKKTRLHGLETMPLALSVLSKDRASARGEYRLILERQLPDGSWEGSSRTTVFALAALRHSSLPLDDPAMDRGWRFLRSLQVWDGETLVQSSCDASNLLHATALRTLLVTSADEEIAAAGTLSLLHQSRASGGCALGGMQPTDLMTTSLVLDALSFAGDVPVETLWARRRAVLLLLRSQNSDGGWPLYSHTPEHRFPSHVDVTSAALQALAFSGLQEKGEEDAILRGVKYLQSKQNRNGLWNGDLNGSAIFSTSRAIEALFAAAEERAGVSVVKAVVALVRCQHADGGWSDRMDNGSTSEHTAWALRALSGAPGVAHEVVAKGKHYLEDHLDSDELVWGTHVATWPLPLSAQPTAVPDLVTIWGLEALAPAGIFSRTRSRGARSRSIFDRSR